MKFTSASAIIVNILATTSWATPTPVSESISASRTSDLVWLASETAGCGAAGACHGFGGGGLCNDRVCFALLISFVSIVQDPRGHTLGERAAGSHGKFLSNSSSWRGARVLHEFDVGSLIGARYMLVRKYANEAWSGRYRHSEPRRYRCPIFPARRVGPPRAPRVTDIPSTLARYPSLRTRRFPQLTGNLVDREPRLFLFNMEVGFGGPSPAKKGGSDATYLVDLLHFLKNTPSDSKADNIKSALGVLASRRPDVLAVESSTTPTKERLPRIAILNELLESFVVTSDDVSTPSQSSTNSAICHERLASQMFPLGLFPHDQDLNATLCYLKAAGIGHYEILSVFGSEASLVDESHDTIPTDVGARREFISEASNVLRRAFAITHLGLKPLDIMSICRDSPYTEHFLDLVKKLGTQRIDHVPAFKELDGIPTHEKWGYRSKEDMLSTDDQKQIGLSFVSSQFIPRSELSIGDLVELVNCRYFRGRLTINGFTGSHEFPGPLSETRLLSVLVNTQKSPEQATGPLTEELCDELQGFIRLKHRLSWSVDQLDDAISSLLENRGANGRTDTPALGIDLQMLEDLSYIIQLGNLVERPVSDLLPLWSRIKPARLQSPYAKLSIHKRLTDVSHLFELSDNCNGFQPEENISRHTPTLLAVLRCREEELDYFMNVADIDRASAKLTIDTISILYRHSLMCQILQTKPAEYQDIMTLLLDDGNMFKDPKSTLETVRMWRQLLDGGWTPADIIATLSSRDTTEQTLHRLTERFELSPGELEYFTTPGAMVELDPKAPSLSSLSTLASYTKLRDSAAAGHDDFISLFRWLTNPTGDSNPASWLATATRWPESKLSLVLNTKYHGFRPDELITKINSVQELSSLHSIFDLCNRVDRTGELPLEQIINMMFQIAATTRQPGHWTKISTALQKCLTSAQLDQCREDLREAHKSALVQYLLQQQRIQELGISSADALFGYLMIDGPEDTQAQTTRLQMAISAIQLFVQRCLLGLEMGSGIPASHIDQKKWRSMKRRHTLF
ncbi:hypothetical protein EDB80DRAFT_774536 [Ilyonectria destructans]|nr:hypothetical protein EDB80DRAFT_774536 [Ilyonectria destructans]